MKGGFKVDFETAFIRLDEDTQQIIFAALWASMDIHAPLDNLTETQWYILEEFANFTRRYRSYDY